MLRAVIFDFNGVIADDEPIHCRLFQEVLAEEGILITKEVYWSRYLHFDDRGAFRQALLDHGRPVEEKKLADLITRKAKTYEAAIRDHLLLFPGAVDLVRETARAYPLALVSGALRREIDLILTAAGIREAFEVIIAAEDVREGKPRPEGYLKALEGLNQNECRPAPGILPEECLVIEDSHGGIEAACRAGMWCLAVAHTYPMAELKEADAAVPSLAGLTVKELERIFHTAKISP
ncbi:MAG: HAD family phosphatase [Nitrospirae bacterium]|nr:HAD family phosphatase [Nitrospirota bacterium]